jgi:hypothetical protein
MSHPSTPDDLPQPPPTGDGRRVAYGTSMGLVAAVLLVPACAFIGAFFDERADPEADLAGLAGFVGGGMVGLAIVFIGAVSAITGGRWRRRPMLRGVGQGMAIFLLVSLLALGICSAVT